MTLYGVHMRGQHLVLVKDGFNWAAAAFGFLWALALGLWELAAVLFGAELVLSLVLGAWLSGSAGTVIQIGAHVLVGFLAADLKRWGLARRGLHEVDVVSGQNKTEAERRFFEGHPHLLAEA